MSKYKVGDKIRIRKDLDIINDCGVVDSMLKYAGMEASIVYTSDDDYKLHIDNGDWCWSDDMFEDEIKDIGLEAEAKMMREVMKEAKEQLHKPLKMRIKYFEGATKLKKISKGNWIDVYANKDMFIPVGERVMIPLGFALELPKGWEAHLAPRSSTFKTWGIIQTNSVGVVDDTYIGDNDEWHFPAYCLQAKSEDLISDKFVEGTFIDKGDKIGQFRIMEVMPEIEFEEVESFGNADRGGFGTTGVK